MRSDEWFTFLLLTLMCLIIQAFFSMMEMATVSFNKVRLQYYVRNKNRRAMWLSSLLSKPSRLFGTTLIGVNAAMQFGSEYSRQFYSSLGLSPDWAPITQVFVVLIFAELSPMFAARRYAEHVSMLGIPILFFASKVLRPFIWALNMIVRGFSSLFGIVGTHESYLTRDELQRAIEGREEQATIDPVLQNIFSLKNKTAKEVMEPIESIFMISEESSVADVRSSLEKDFLPFMPIYRGQKKNVVGIIYPRDLLQYSSAAKVKNHLRPAWFVTETTTTLHILKQFKRNNQTVAIVLNKVGIAVGVLTLDSIVDEIFGQEDHWVSIPEFLPTRHNVFVDRSFSGETLVRVVNETYGIQLPLDGEKTLEDVMEEILGHAPEPGQRVQIGQYELELSESSLINGRFITIRTVY